MVTVPVPDGTLLFPAFSLPDTLMLAVPCVIVKGVGPGLRLLNVGCNLRTLANVHVELGGRFVFPTAVTVAVSVTGPVPVSL
jgi:hypothetical protein